MPAKKNKSRAALPAKKARSQTRSTPSRSATRRSAGKLIGASQRELLEAGRGVIESEGMYLDDRRWDDWLALYAERCEYWVPTWKMDGSLTTSPEDQLSHIYYSNRAGLAERVSRLTSRWAPASAPVPRTCHIVSNVRLVEVPAKDRIQLRSSWVTHALYVRQRQTYAFFGTAEYQLELASGNWLITRKKVILKNDYIPSMIDVNCL
jgi:3-phenylpropionate/cinnamic acid dioxygenase small subunit